MHTTRTFAILLAALVLASGTPLLVVAAQEPSATETTQESRASIPVDVTHRQLGLRF